MCVCVCVCVCVAVVEVVVVVVVVCGGLGSGGAAAAAAAAVRAWGAPLRARSRQHGGGGGAAGAKRHTCALIVMGVMMGGGGPAHQRPLGVKRMCAPSVTARAGIGWSEGRGWAAACTSCWRWARCGGPRLAVHENGGRTGAVALVQRGPQLLLGVDPGVGVWGAGGGGRARAQRMGGRAAPGGWRAQLRVCGAAWLGRGGAHTWGERVAAAVAAAAGWAVGSSSSAGRATAKWGEW